MAADWLKVAVSEIATKITKGSTPTKSDGGYAVEGINFIKAESITAGGWIDTTKVAYVESAVYEKYKRSKLEKDDVLFTMAGVLGRSALVTEDVLPANTNQAIGLIRPDKEKVFPKYLFYALREPSLVHFVNNSTSQSAQPNINLAQIGDLKIRLPSLPEQIRIADSLSYLDNKIELNRQMNETLEAMAQALFKSWFVDFDPVIDNALAAGSEIPEPLQQRAEMRKALGDQRKPLPPEIQSLFPNRFVFTEEMGWVPEGWERVSLDSQIDVLNGFAFKSGDYVPEGTFVLRTKNFNSDSRVELLSDDVYLPDEFLITHAKYLCEPFDYHLIMVGASVGNRGLILPHQLPALRNQNMWCFRPRTNSGCSRVFVKLLLDNLIQGKMSLASGSAREFFRKGDFQKHLILYGCDMIQAKFQSLAGTYLEKIAVNCSQNDNLAMMRDTLLPKLLSGELRIPDAEKQVAEAL